MPFGNSTDSANLPVDSTPAPVELPPDAAASTEATSIGTGFYNTFVTCRNGRVYCSGENQYRQCGLGSTNIHAPMRRISELDGRRIVQAEGRYCHTLARTIEGHVHTQWVDPRMVSVASMQTMDDRFRWRRGWLCPTVTTVPSSRWPRG
jgi:hypothetical protein